MKANTLSLTLILTLYAGASAAQTTRKPIFVSPEQLDIAAILPAPPAAGSWQHSMELAELHRIQEERTPAEVAHAQQDDKNEHIFIFETVFGPGFNRIALPATALLSDHVKNDEGIIVGPAKKFFARPRPYHFDATIQSVCKTTENRADFGYPSGHGTTGYLEALVLIQIAPEKRREIMARADDYAHSREVCGAHYASDEAASQATAYAMMALMMNHPQFQRELAAARVETRSALGLAPAMAANSGR
jgi:acid phosphatase (class A)